MPPKSSSHKKDNALQWFHCEKCNVNITSNDRELHENYCPITTYNDLSQPFTNSFIYNKKLYSTTFGAKPSQININILNDTLNPTQLNGFVFLSESVMNLCGFILGEKVSICSPQITPPAVIKTAWPIPDRFATSVFVTDYGKLLFLSSYF